jgi:phosphatidylglycerophosphate synthase
MSKKSVVNAANLTTVVGFALTVYGSTILNSWTGLVLVTVGRLFDILDGYVARHFKLASTFGATLDATLDKLGGLSILIAEWHFGIAPLWAISLMFLQNVANATASYLYARKFHTMLMPSIDGKHAMFAQNLAVGSFALAYLIQNSYISSFFWGAGIVLTVVGVGYFGFRATKYYYDEAV